MFCFTKLIFSNWAEWIWGDLRCSGLVACTFGKVLKIIINMDNVFDEILLWKILFKEKYTWLKQNNSTLKIHGLKQIPVLIEKQNYGSLGFSKAFFFMSALIKQVLFHLQKRWSKVNDSLKSSTNWNLLPKFKTLQTLQSVLFGKQ